MVFVLSWLSLSTSALMVAPRAPPVIRRAAGTSMIKIAKASNTWDDVEKEMLGRLSLGTSNEAAATSTDGKGDADPPSAQPTPDTGSELSQPTPRSGTQAWGQWSHEADSIVLDLALPEGVRAKELICEVSKSGVMRVESNTGESFLLGTLALPVDRTELMWVVEEQDDGSKLLCIELPMLPIDTSRRMLSVDCIFDESLVINGQQCLAPGLSGVNGKA